MIKIATESLRPIEKMGFTVDYNYDYKFYILKKDKVPVAVQPDGFPWYSLLDDTDVVNALVKYFKECEQAYLTRYFSKFINEDDIKRVLL